MSDQEQSTNPEDQALDQEVVEQEVASESKDNEILNEEEIDALVGENASSGPRAFDFTSQDKIVRGKMPTLEMIGDRYIRNFKLSLYNLMRKTAEITPGPIQVVKFSDHISTFGKPTSFNIVEIEPLRGNGLVVLNGSLVSSLVETFFGGDGFKEAKHEEREFTAAEIRITRRFLDIIFQDMMDAWAPIYPITMSFVKAENNPSLAKIVTPSELIVVQSFQIELETGQGELQLMLPYAMIEPIRSVLDAGVQSDMDTPDERWTGAIKSSVIHAEVLLSCVMQEVKVSLKDIIKLNKGDIIPIEMPDRARIEAGGTPIFEAKFGVHDNHYAAQILKFIKEENYD